MVQGCLCAASRVGTFLQGESQAPLDPPPSWVFLSQWGQFLVSPLCPVHAWPMAGCPARLTGEGGGASLRWARQEVPAVPALGCAVPWQRELGVTAPKRRVCVPSFSPALPFCSCPEPSSPAPHWPAGPVSPSFHPGYTQSEHLKGTHPCNPEHPPKEPEGRCVMCLLLKLSPRALGVLPALGPQNVTHWLPGDYGGLKPLGEITSNRSCTFKPR